MTLPKLALKNLLGAGLRTWLNVFVLSLSFVLIIFVRGLIEGMNRQAERAMIAAEVAGGHVQHPAYDPYDPLTLKDAHGPVPAPLADLAAAGKAAPILIIQGTIYPEGRLFTVRVKGIDPGQRVIDVPTALLAGASPAPDDIPALIGARLAKTTGLKKGDTVQPPVARRSRHVRRPRGSRRRDLLDLGPDGRHRPDLGPPDLLRELTGMRRRGHDRCPGPRHAAARAFQLGLPRPGLLPRRPQVHGRR